MSRNGKIVSFERHLNGPLIRDEDLCRFFGTMKDTVVRIVCHDVEANEESKGAVVKDPDIKHAQKTCSEKDSRSREGTGVVISPGYILTAAHILVGPLTTDYTIFFHHFDDETVWKAEVVYLDPAADLVLLRRCSSVGPGNYARLADDVVIGQQAFTIGHSGSNEYTFAVGQVAYPRRNVLKERFTGSESESESVSESETKTEIPLESYLHIQSNNLHNEGGASGGPVFNSKGLVIGIHVSRDNGYDMSVHFEQVKKFLKAANFQI